MTVGFGSYDGADFGQRASSAPDSSKPSGPGLQSDLESDVSSWGHLKIPVAGHAIIKDKSKDSSPDTRKRIVRSTRGFSASKHGDETAEMWKRALRAESSARSPRSSMSARKSDSGSVRVGPKLREQISQATNILEQPHNSVTGSYDHSPKCNEVPPPDQADVIRQALVRSNTVLEEWARQLQYQEKEAKANTQAISSASRPNTKNSKIPPASWARFPSYNREERNASAGPEDHVKLKDFAVKEVPADGESARSMDKDQFDAFPGKSMVRSFSDRFSQPFKSRWSKLVPSRTAIPSKDNSMLGKRRSSLQTSGDLEYPELELLPTAGGYKELRALEKEISEMKRRVGSDTRASSAEVGARPSLTERMDDVAQHDGLIESTLSTSSCNGSVTLRRSTAPTCRHLSTPVEETKYQDTSSTNDLTDSSGQRYATPFSHICQSPYGASRTVVLPNDNQPSTVPPSPFSSKTSVSFIRRSSITGPNGHTSSTVPIMRCNSWGGRGSLKRQPAILCTTPVSP